MSSLGVYSVVLAGWSSNNKYSLLGALRASAQMLSYEVFMGLSVLGVVAIAGSFSLSAIVEAPRPLWFAVPQFLGFVVFFIAGIAETRRLPFDLPESDSELLAGFHTEYSGMKFGMFFVGEYLGLTLISMMITTLFLGGWQGPILPRVRLVLRQDLHPDRLLRAAEGIAPQAALRSVDGAGVEDHAARGSAQSGGHRRRPAGYGVGNAMLSALRSIWLVFLHMFRKRDTIQYPDEKPYLPPRFKGRIVLTRDPDGDERCVACYLCSAACPVDCIALQKAAASRRPALPGLVQDQLLSLHLLRVLRGGVSDLRDPAHPGLLHERVPAGEHGLRERGPADQRPGQVPWLQLLPGGGAGDRRQGQGRGRGRGSADGCERTFAVTMDVVFYRIGRQSRLCATALAVTRLNAVHALLYLILSLLAVAVAFYTLGAPFVAALEVIVYAGAIMVLFLFVVMMLNVGPAQSRETTALGARNLDRSGRACRDPCWSSWFTSSWADPATPCRATRSAPKEVSVALYGPYLLGVELASMLLLAGLVGAYHLGRKDPREEESR